MAKKSSDTDYQNWRKTLPVNLQYEGDYDLRGYYDKYGAVKIDQNSKQHLTDEFKLPNHKTFSDESVHYNFATMPQGGHWKGDVYMPNDPLIKDIVDETPIKAYGGQLMTKYARGRTIKRFDSGGGLDPNSYAASGKYNQSNLNYNGSNSALGSDVGATLSSNYQGNGTTSGNMNTTGTGSNMAGYAKYAPLVATAATSLSGLADNKASIRDKEGMISNTETAVAGAINPLFGAIHAGVSAVMNPLTNYAHRLNDDGTLKNRQMAINERYGQILADPLATIGAGATNGFKDFAGKGYADSLEKDPKAAYAEKQAADKAASDAAAKQKYDEQMNYTRAYNMANPSTGREGSGIYAHGGNFIYDNGGAIPTGDPIAKPVYNTAVQNNYPMYHQRIVNGQPTYWKGSFHGTADAWKNMNRNPTPYVPNAVSITADEYNQNLGTGNMMPTYTVPPDPFTNAPTVTTPTNVVPVQGNGGFMGINPAHKGYCTPMSKSTCTGHRRALAETLKKHHGFQKAFGGAVNVPYSMKAAGGDLVPLASNVTKAVGDTHEEDTNQDGRNGITLQANGSPIAEVENQEVMHDGKVFSDRLKLAPGLTFAKKAEQLGKKKGKYEELGETTNTRQKNGADRMLANVNSDLENLFYIQEMSKAGTSTQPVNTPTKASGGTLPAVDWSKVADNSIPYLDNIYNTGLIANTPDIPNPTKRVAYDLSPVALKTNYNINPALNDADRNYQMLNKDMNENTSNSVTARGNKLAGFVGLLNNKSALYNTKENAETDFINKNNMNVQSVIDRNTGNRQTIANENNGLTDNFNWAKMQRASDINTMKGQNFANMVNNMTTQVQDRNMSNVDSQRIMMDALKYNDAAGFAKTIGTPSMDSIIRSNPQSYTQIEKALINAGQNSALEEFYKRYGKNN